MANLNRQQPIIFLRVGWMSRYAGLGSGDDISGGGSYVDEHGFGHEIFNFKSADGQVYGYVQPPAREGKWQDSNLNIERLGGRPQEDRREGVLAVWVATAPTGGSYIVGWYRNATVFRNWQPPPRNSGRNYRDESCGYYVSAIAGNAVLLPPDSRTYMLPRRGEGGFGQANVLYADQSDRYNYEKLRAEIVSYIDRGGRRPPGKPLQPDPLHRQQVERRAVEMVHKHYAALGYGVRSVEQDNAGWDLEAELGERKLFLEVKGLTGKLIRIGLTPNEYRAMEEERVSYRLCIVTDTLGDPELYIFSYFPELGTWHTDDGRSLRIEEITAAVCSAT